MAHVRSAYDTIQRDEFLRQMELAGWPWVDSDDLSSGTMRAMGRLGPGEEFWRSFARLAPLSQLRHLRSMWQWNPTVFHSAKGVKEEAAI